MHPHLYTDGKQKACGDIIKALEECRENGLMFRILGGCQEIDKKLGKCLREERLSRTRANQEKSSIREQKKQAAWSRLEQEVNEQKQT